MFQTMAFCDCKAETAEYIYRRDRNEAFRAFQFEAALYNDFIVHYSQPTKHSFNGRFYDVIRVFDMKYSVFRDLERKLRSSEPKLPYDEFEKRIQDNSLCYRKECARNARRPQPSHLSFQHNFTEFTKALWNLPFHTNFLIEISWCYQPLSINDANEICVPFVNKTIQLAKLQREMLLPYLEPFLIKDIADIVIDYLV